MYVLHAFRAFYLHLQNESPAARATNSDIYFNRFPSITVNFVPFEFFVAEISRYYQTQSDF